MPDESKFESVSANYAGSGAEEYFAYQQTDVRRNNWVSKRFFEPHVTASDSVVDYGCGTGWLLKLLEVGNRLGVEPNPKAREFADSIGIETVEAPDEVADASADVVISNHALEHSLAPLDELRQIRRIVKPEGQIVICLPIDDWRRQRKADPTDPNHHLYTWTPLLFANLLGEAGFSVTETRAFSFLQTPPYWRFDRLPEALFNLTARAYGIKCGYHQLVAVARPS